VTGAGIHIVVNEGRQTAIRSDRPVHAARVFAGKSPDTALRLLPMLFSVCGLAQATAGTHALKAALGEGHSDRVTRAHAALVRLEIAREHLWRISMDWPRFTQHTLGSASLAAMQALLPRSREALFDGEPFGLEPSAVSDTAALEDILSELERLLKQDVLGIAPDEWLALGSVGTLADYARETAGAVPDFLRLLDTEGWQAACPSSPASLPALPGDAIDKVLANGTADAFVETPDWEGRPRETSPLTRATGNPLLESVTTEHGFALLARAVAAINELASTTRDVRAVMAGDIEPAIHAERTNTTTAVAQVEAARGLLVHRVAIADGLVDDYRIVAPTEWNFHPAGSVTQALAALPSADRQVAEMQAALFVTLMDPCVAWSLEVH